MSTEHQEHSTDNQSKANRIYADKHGYLRKGTPLPTGTATADFNADPDNITSGKRASGDGLLNDWMGGDRSYRVTEEVVGLGQYGRTLTVLTSSSLSLRPEADEDEYEEEAALMESWTPRFRK